MDHLLTCILNGKAGSNRTAEAQALVRHAAAEHEWKARILLSSTGSNLNMLAEQARGSGGLVVAGGGDGTIATVAAALAGRDAMLGVLPMGTLNHFARDLHIPLDLNDAVANLFTGTAVRIDAAEVNGHIFLNNSSIGFYPQILQERERQQRQGRNKWLTLSQAAALMLLSGTEEAAGDMAEVSGAMAVGAMVVGAIVVGVMEAGDIGADGSGVGGREFTAASTADIRPMVMAEVAPMGIEGRWGCVPYYGYGYGAPVVAFGFGYGGWRGGWGHRGWGHWGHGGWGH